VSPVVQALPSLQGLVLLVKTQPVAGLQLSVVHTFASLQTVGVPGLHVPPPQASPVVQALPSLHGLVLFVKTQAPVAGLQLSVVQTLLSLQTVGAPGTQLPPPQASPVVQALPSLQGFVLFANTQPEAGLQLSVVQTLLSLQTVGAPDMHAPPPQTSPVVQALPSLQALVLFVKTQAPVVGLQLSVVQTLLSLQTVAVPGRQLPPRHSSPVVQALSSLHVFELSFECLQPFDGLQLSSVHGLLSLQSVGPPPWHEPPPQASLAVHGLPSLQGLVLFVKKQAPVDGLQASVVQALLSLQVVEVPGRHVPPPQ
jgi:hypothetical protein